MRIEQGWVDFDSGNIPDMKIPLSRPGRRSWGIAVPLALSDDPQPTVILTVQLMDHIQNPLNNLRYEIFADEVSATGFDVRLETWDDTLLAKVRIRWTAIFP